MSTISISTFQSIAPYEALKLLQHLRNVFSEFSVVLVALGSSELVLRTAHPPCMFPLFTGSSPPTNLPIVGQADLRPI